MEMTTCPMCGKIHGSGADAICKSCRTLVEIVYEKSRNYLRDHPKDEGMNAAALAEAIGEDVRIIQILMMEGRFTGNPEDEHQLESEDEKRRKQLLDDLKKNLVDSGPSDKQMRSATYGSDRHSR